MNGAGGLEQRTVYRIVVKGTLDETWSDWFEGLSLVSLERGETLLTGPIVDQAALYGILWKLRDLNLTLLSVASIEAPLSEGAAAGKGPALDKK
jgi:hypothetical protein